MADHLENQSIIILQIATELKFTSLKQLYRCRNLRSWKNNECNKISKVKPFCFCAVIGALSWWNSMSFILKNSIFFLSNFWNFWSLCWNSYWTNSFQTFHGTLPLLFHWLLFYVFHISAPIIIRYRNVSLSFIKFFHC